MTYEFAVLLNATMRLTTDPKAGCWYDRPAVTAILNEAATNGWVRRISTTQVQWTVEGVKAYDAAIGKADRVR